LPIGSDLFTISISDSSAHSARLVADHAGLIPDKFIALNFGTQV